MKQKLVSVIIPYFKHKNYIEQLLISIKKQTYKNIEIILIDDGSHDGSIKLLKLLSKKYKFSLFNQKNKGVCTTLNRGVSLSRGEFIKIMDSDDLMVENQIQQQVNILSSSDYDVIGGGMTLINKNSNVINYQSPRKLGQILFKDVLFNNPIYGPTMMFRASAFDKFGNFDRENPIEDFSIILTMISKGAKVFNFDLNWAKYRVSEHNYLSKAKWYFEGVMHTLSRYDNTSTINQAKNYHIFLYLIKLALFNGLKNKNNFLKIFKTQQNFLRQFIGFIIIYTAAILPQSLRKFFQNKIIFKSGKIISTTNLLK